MYTTIQDSSILGPSSKFANHALHFTKHRDSEFGATSPNNDYDPFDPVIAFEDYVNGCVSTSFLPPFPHDTHPFSSSPTAKASLKRISSCGSTSAVRRLLLPSPVLPLDQLTFSSSDPRPSLWRHSQHRHDAGVLVGRLQPSQVRPPLLPSQLDLTDRLFPPTATSSPTPPVNPPSRSASTTTPPPRLKSRRSTPSARRRQAGFSTFPPPISTIFRTRVARPPENSPTRSRLSLARPSEPREVWRVNSASRYVKIDLFLPFPRNFPSSASLSLLPST